MRGRSEISAAIRRQASAALLLATLATPALAQTALPPGATLAPDVKALRSYQPVRPPGGTDFDATDRAAIANLLYAYSFAYDNGEAETWFSLFTPDAVFTAGVPGQEPIAMSGEGFRAFCAARMKQFAASGHMRRHLMSNILYLDQSATTAHVSVVGLLTDAKDGRVFTPVTSLNYEGWLVKQAGSWKIQRWHDFPDAGLGE